jgi:hypothetical protein
MSKILHIVTFDTICISSFGTKCVHYTMETPRCHKIYFFLKEKGKYILQETNPPHVHPT